MIGCDLCGARFARGEVFYRREGSFVCGECAGRLGTQELLFLTNTGGTGELLGVLGYEKEFI